MRIRSMRQASLKGAVALRMVVALAMVAMMAPVVAAGVAWLFPAVVPIVAQLGSGASIPQQINHQGVVMVDNARFEGTGQFRFAIVNTVTGNNLWTNDGSQVPGPGQPAAAVSLLVADGVYSVMLGDAGLANMTAIPVGMFDTTSVALRIWFDDGVNGIQQLLPDQPLTSAPFAFRAQVADNGSVPGEVKMWAGTDANVPTGYLPCNGAAVSRTTYAGLFSVIGTAYGEGDGATTFNVPDLRQRFPLGKADSGTGSALGGTGGAIDHTHTGPSHTHTYAEVIAHTHSVDPPSTTSSSGGAHTHTFSATTSSAGDHYHQMGNQTNFKDGSYYRATSGNTFHYWGMDGWGTNTFNTRTAGAHTHTVSGTTGGVSANHTHTVDVPAFTSGSTGVATGTTAAAGTGATGGNNPPFVVVNYIIKY